MTTETTTPPSVDNTARDAARATLAAKKADPAAVQRYLSGDSAEKAEWARLQEAAHPGDADEGIAPDQTDGDDAIPPDPSSYRLDYPHGVEVDKQLDSEAREIFHAAELPNALARQFFNGYEKIAAKVRETGKAPGPAEIEIGKRSAEFKLRGMWGEKYEQKMEAAKGVLKALPPEKYERAMVILNSTGLGSDVHLIANLAALGERRAKSK